ncbi:MAG: hypothetical protein AMXMBFR58_34220 [Phycisphaerae bacterium]
MTTGPSSQVTPPRSPRADRTITAVAWLLTLLLVVMLGRVIQLQLAPSRELEEQRQSRITTRTELAVRGDILDRRGRLVTATRFAWRVYVDPVILTPETIDLAIMEIAQALAKPPEEIADRVLWALEENMRRAEVAAGLEPATPARPAPDQWLRELVGLETPRTEPAPVVAAPADPQPSVFVDQASGYEVSAISFGDVPAPPVVLKPIRYLPFRDLVEDAVAATLRQKKIAGVVLERVPVREEVAGAPVAALVGKVGVDANIGMEARLDDRLSGKAGRVSYYRDARMRPLWIEPGQVQLPVHGEDVRLSIDLELQAMGLAELNRGIEEADAAGGRLVAIDPRTGEILAMCDIVRDLPGLKEYPWEDDPRALARDGKKRAPTLPYMAPRPGSARYRTIQVDKASLEHPDIPALRRNRCAEDVYEPGSTFKPFVWSTITELGLAGVEETIDTENGRWVTPYGRKLNDVTKRDVMTWSNVLVNSSNIGMAKVVERLTHRQLHDAVRRFGFGKPTAVGVAGEASGLVTPLKEWTIYSQTSYAMGHEVAVTPLQMVRGFSAFARTGQLAGTLADLRLTAVTPGEIASSVLYRVLPARIADLTRLTMRGVAENMQNRLQQTDHSQTGWKYTIFGKSGTAEIPLGKPPPGKRAPAGSTGYYDDQYNSSFIAGGPIEDPRLVVLVVIDDPGPELVFARPLPRHYGAVTAGPVVRRFMERALTYLGAPPSVTPDQDPTPRADLATAAAAAD